MTASTEIKNSIIAGNTINDVGLVFSPGGITSFDSDGFNLVGGGNAVIFFNEDGDQINVLDPMLGPLARLGGPTPVHRLLPDSSAIDMGDPTTTGLGFGSTVPIYDQRGLPFDRIVNLGGGRRIDIGAFEVQNDVLLVGNVLTDPGAAFTTFLAALEESNSTSQKETILFLPTFSGPVSGAFNITDSVDIIGISGLQFVASSILIDNSMELLDVSFENFSFVSNTRIENKENLKITNMQFVGNAATANGGAISHENGKLTISDSTFIGNLVSGSGFSGGAIYVLGGDLEINNSVLSGNSTSTGVLGGSGGAIYIRDGDLLDLLGGSFQASLFRLDHALLKSGTPVQPFATQSQSSAT